MNKIKTFEDACLALGILASIPDFSAMPEKMQKPLLAHYKLVIIAEALNEGWVPDWTNGEWDKYYPWFKMGSPSGVGFSCGDFVGWDSYSVVGSRLCFKSSKLAEYAGKQFESLYKEYFIIE